MSKKKPDLTVGEIWAILLATGFIYGVGKDIFDNITMRTKLRRYTKSEMAKLKLRNDALIRALTIATDNSVDPAEETERLRYEVEFLNIIKNL